MEKLNCLKNMPAGKQLYSVIMEGRYRCTGERVLFPSKDCRSWDSGNWQLDLFSHLSSMEVTVCVGHVWNQCIPYNEDTKDLLGTSKQPSDFYNIFQS